MSKRTLKDWFGGAPVQKIVKPSTPFIDDLGQISTEPSTMQEIQNFFLSGPSQPDEATSCLEQQENAPSNQPTIELATSFVTFPSSSQIDARTSCQAGCCTLNIAFHPKTEKELKGTINKDGRRCQLSWFTTFPWLDFCISRNKVFCFVCRAASIGGKHPPGIKNQKDAFVNEGFDNWKRAIERFDVHSKSKVHLACASAQYDRTKPAINVQIVSSLQKQQLQRRTMLVTQVSSLIYLLRQGLALRGHIENESNLTQLLFLRANDIPGLHEYIKNGRYLSHDIINELTKEIALTVLRGLLKKISSRQWFSLICDETADESSEEQLCVTIRTVDENYEIHEDVLGLYKLNRQTAASISEAILDVLTLSGLSMANCRGQGYDGASTMAGIHSGVAALLLLQQPKAIFVHCSAHCLDLALQDLSCNCSSIDTAITYCKDIITFLRRSPKRLAITEELAQHSLHSQHYTKLKALCPTRWTVRAASMRTLLKNYKLVQDVLQTVADAKDKSNCKANAYLYQMETFKFYFGLSLAQLIFCATEQVSTTMQYTSNNLQEIMWSVETVLKYFERIRDDNNFKQFYEASLRDSESLTHEPNLPRSRRPPKRFDDGLTHSTYNTAEEYYKHQYFNAIHIVTDTLQNRFKQPAFIMLTEVELFLLRAANEPCLHADDYNKIEKFLQDDINVDHLKLEARMISDHFRVVNERNKLNIKRITRVSTICDLMNSSQAAKIMFPEYDKVIRLYLTIPVTTATAERAFSSLNRLKTCLRSTMGQARLNHCLLAHIYKEHLDTIDTVAICSTFVKTNERRQAFFGVY
jgi:hypothetical protein